jgi:hypothetical protein
MATIPPDERARLAALYDLAILDTPREEIYDDVARLAAAICDSIALSSHARARFARRRFCKRTA